MSFLPQISCSLSVIENISAALNWAEGNVHHDKCTVGEKECYGRDMELQNGVAPLSKDREVSEVNCSSVITDSVSLHNDTLEWLGTLCSSVWHII